MYSDTERPYRGGEMRKFFISYNSKDSTKAKWIAWAIEQFGDRAFVHEWETAPAAVSQGGWRTV